MEIVYSKDVHAKWKDYLNHYGILYLYAMSGFGKTVQVVTFAKKEYKEWIRLEASEQIIEDLDDYIVQKKGSRTKILLIIDDLQWLQEKKQQERFLEKILWILKNHRMVHCIFLSRARLPEYLMVLKLTKQLVVEDQSALVLDREMIAGIIENSGLIKKRPDLFGEANLVQNHTFEQCVKISKGYAIALNAYIERLKESNLDCQAAYTLGLRDVFTYYDIHIYKVWDLRHREAMMRLSVCDFFDIELAKVILGEEAEELVSDMYQIGSFISEERDKKMHIRPNFLAFLREKLNQIAEKERQGLYERVGHYYEENRNIIEALQCYKQAGLFDRMIYLMAYLSENADGCAFAKSCYSYLEELPREYEERFPKLLAIKAMIYSYHMELDKSNLYLDKLKEKAREEKNSKVGKEALTNYVRTLIALPHGSAEKAKENLQYFPAFIKENGIQIKNIIATGNMPSMINGGLDLLSWSENYKELYPLMKLGSEMLIGKEAVGIADVSVGEHLYELNQMAKSISHLTRGLSEANLKGSIRVQYAATGIMAKVFQADNQWDTAYEIMQNIWVRAKESSYLELVPNIEASIIELELQQGNMNHAKFWLESDPADEHSDFFITERYRLWIKAKVYVSQGRNLEALYILELLESYVVLFKRPYLQMQLQILRAIIYERTGEAWKEELLKAAKTSETHQYIRILADQGTALLPLWKELITDQALDKELGVKFKETVTKEMTNMAGYYPKYLGTQKKFEAVTKKEMEVLRLMADGMNNQQIAQQLNLSTATVKFHVSKILKKLQADNRTSAVYRAKQENLL